MVVLHTVGAFACTSDVVRRISEAHWQVHAKHHLHRVAVISRTPLAKAHSISEEDATALARFNKSLAHAGPGVVSMIGALQVHRAFPAVLARMCAVRWGDSREPSWLANGCDLPALTWFRLHGKRGFPHEASHLWVLQHDIGWTGRLPAILARFEPTADLLCDNLGNVGAEWPHFEEHNHLPSGRGVASCMLPAARYSVRLLAELLAGLDAGNVSYCEIRAPTACAYAPWDCTMAELRATPGLLGPFAAYAIVDEQELHKTFKEVDEGGGVGRLFHRVQRNVHTRPRNADCPMVCPLEPRDMQCPGTAPVECLDGARCCASVGGSEQRKQLCREETSAGIERYERVHGNTTASTPHRSHGKHESSQRQKTSRKPTAATTAAHRAGNSPESRLTRPRVVR